MSSGTTPSSADEHRLELVLGDVGERPGSISRNSGQDSGSGVGATIRAVSTVRGRPLVDHPVEGDPAEEVLPRPAPW